MKVFASDKFRGLRKRNITADRVAIRKETAFSLEASVDPESNTILLLLWLHHAGGEPASETCDSRHWCHASRC